MRTSACFIVSVIGATLWATGVALAQTPAPGAEPAPAAPTPETAAPAPAATDTAGQIAPYPAPPPPATAAPAPAPPPPAAAPPPAPPPVVVSQPPPPPPTFEPPARKEGLKRLHVSFSIDRAFGVYAWNGTGKPVNTNVETKISGTTVSFLVPEYLTNFDDFMVNASGVPRISVDAFPVAGLSVGGSIGFWIVSGERNDTLNDQTVLGRKQDLPSTTGYLFAPRVGYLIAFNPYIGLWPRAGITYVKSTNEYTPDPGETEYTKSSSVSFTQVNIETMLVLSPVSHFAFNIGPIVDVGVGGSYNEKNQSDLIDEKADFTFTAFGLSAGLMGYF